MGCGVASEGDELAALSAFPSRRDGPMERDETDGRTDGLSVGSVSEGRERAREEEEKERERGMEGRAASKGHDTMIERDKEGRGRTDGVSD